jgi:hypothetical protein
LDEENIKLDAEKFGERGALCLLTIVKKKPLKKVLAPFILKMKSWVASTHFIKKQSKKAKHDILQGFLKTNRIASTCKKSLARLFAHAQHLLQ